MRWVPVRGNERNTEKSRFQPPGPRNWFGRCCRSAPPGLRPRGRVHIEAGGADVADHIHRPDQIGGLQVARRIQPVPSAVTVNGEPLKAPKIPLTCQSLISARAIPPLPVSLRHGSW